MLIRHLGLTVTDPAASKDFYVSVIGLDGDAHPEPWGYRITLTDGFMLALIQGEPLPTSDAETVHFGCILDGPDHARRLRQVMRNAGVHEVEWEDSTTYVGAKVLDPDGYVVELYVDLV